MVPWLVFFFLLFFLREISSRVVPFLSSPVKSSHVYGVKRQTKKKDPVPLEGEIRITTVRCRPNKAKRKENSSSALTWQKLLRSRLAELR